MGVTRRGFLGESVLLAGGFAAGVGSASGPRILNQNENMEYRRCGKTGLMVSAVCLGGHWKRIETVVPDALKTKNWLNVDVAHGEFAKNRHDVVSRCIDVGINYIDACTGPEVMAYAEALRGRRDKMYLGYSWYDREVRYPDWRCTEKLLQGFDDGLLAAGLDYVDLWRITCHEPGGQHTFNESEALVTALDKAKRQGKARFTGISSHDRRWLKMMIEQYPEQIDVILTPYTADSKALSKDSLFDTVRKYGVGVFGIKPFASNALFQGDSRPGGPHAEEDNRRARLALRYVLGNAAITAPIPGMVNIEQVDNAAKAVMERRQLDEKEMADLKQAAGEMWANLPDHYEWLKNWEYV